MPPPLDYAELKEAADELERQLHDGGAAFIDSEAILRALINIAKRTLEQAAIPQGRYESGGYGEAQSEIYPLLIVGEPPVLLSVALAALDAPENDTPEGRTVLTEEQLGDLTDKIRRT